MCIGRRSAEEHDSTLDGCRMYDASLVTTTIDIRCVDNDTDVGSAHAFANVIRTNSTLTKLDISGGIVVCLPL